LIVSIGNQYCRAVLVHWCSLVR